jgi:hypothetical protein
MLGDIRVGTRGDLKSHIFAITVSDPKPLQANADEDMTKTLVVLLVPASSCDADNDGDRICETNETCITIAITTSR